MTDSFAPYFAHIHPAGYRKTAPASNDTFNHRYLIKLSDASWLEIPLCALPGDQQAIALLMSNQCPLSVTEHLSGLIAEKAAMFQPESIVAIPTMGLEYGSRVAAKLRMEHYVAMGFSHKFWYDEHLKEAVVSSTSPDQRKFLYLDPALLNRVQGKRVVIVDDVINTGASMLAATRLLRRAGAEVAGIVVALTEGYAWRETLSDISIMMPDKVSAAGHIPLFMKKGSAWVAQPDT
ncbi:Orotate phosphoribosyltransferase [Saezia sanguinis]|uniref:Orotate phosphoribosyltransferase n=1 Tax=Saezia sanguinis TaxID=1965230 RepID=A0A433SDH1_9BURK|nr:phosphoribosyltransferase [Saezia sanguinis]RUS66775.1 Orotate phosphoribosyltransferase [Saezia sanguinis]